MFVCRVLCLFWVTLPYSHNQTQHSPAVHLGFGPATFWYARSHARASAGTIATIISAMGGAYKYDVKAESFRMAAGESGVPSI